MTSTAGSSIAFSRIIRDRRTGSPPARPAPRPTGAGPEGAPRERGASVAKPLNVYIVDDSKVQTDIARALLERAGPTVTINHSRADWLRAIGPGRPDCVLMDIMMPQLDGYELCRRLRAMPELAQTKLLMMSTKAYPFERKGAFELGASGYFTKG